MFQAGKSGNPGGRPKEKPIRDALRMELAATDLPGYQLPKPYTLRALARAQIEKAANGDTQAFKEIADRIEGKVPQGIGGDDDLPDMKLRVSWISQSLTSPEPSSSDTTNEPNAGPALSPTAELERQ